MSKKVINILIFSAVVTTFSNFQHPVTPVYLTSIGFDMSSVGLLFSFMALGLSIAAPLAGRVADKYGTRLPMFVGIIGYAIAQVLFALNTNMYVLILLRFLAGISVAFVYPMMIIYISKVTKPENRALVMSIYAGIAIMFVSIGYKIGGLLEQVITAQQIFLVQGVILTAIAIWGLFLKNVKTDYVKKDKFSFKSFDKDVLKVFLLYFLTSGIFMTVSRMLDVLIIDLGYTANDTGNFVLVTGLIGLFTNFILLPFLSKRFTELRIMRAALLISAITLFITFTMFDNIWLGLYSIFLVYMMAKSAYAPMHNSYISKLDEDKQGEIIGISESARMFGMFVFPSIAGFVYVYNYKILYISLAVLLLGAYVIGRTLNGSTSKSVR